MENNKKFRELYSIYLELGHEVFDDVGVLDTGVSRSTCSWAPSTAQVQPRGKPTTEAQRRRPS
jgi:hypothetical protein